MRALATAIGFVALIDACQGQECMQFRQPSDADNETGCASWAVEERQDSARRFSVG